MNFTYYLKDYFGEGGGEGWDMSGQEDVLLPLGPVNSIMTFAVREEARHRLMALLERKAPAEWP